MFGYRKVVRSAWAWWCISILSPWGGGEVPATLVPTVGHLLLQKYGKKLEESFAPGLAAACTMDTMLRCLPAGLILQAAPTSTLSPFRDAGSSRPFFIKAGIGTSGLPLAPWQSFPARAPCQMLAGLGLISSGSAPAMETGGGCCSRARRGATTGRWWQELLDRSSPSLPMFLRWHG